MTKTNVDLAICTRLGETFFNEKGELMIGLHRCASKKVIQHGHLPGLGTEFGGVLYNTFKVCGVQPC